MHTSFYRRREPSTRQHTLVSFYSIESRFFSQRRTSKMLWPGVLTRSPPCLFQISSTSSADFYFFHFDRIFSVFSGISDDRRVLIRLHPAQHTQELNMKKLAMMSLSLALLASSSAFAEGKTRAEVYQELIEAQQNGLAFVTDASYPDVSPAFASTVEHMKAERLAKQGAASNMASNASAVPGVQ
ncbi:hypothetical protein P3T16_000786 [Paraburkholderia sp. GAS42]